MAKEAFAKVKIIHIGLDAGGKRWLEIIRDCPNMTTVGCVDSETAALDWTRKHYPTLSSVCHTSLQEALKNSKVDAVIISSPPPFHADHCIQALEAGLAVMVEKPFANIDDALRVSERSEKLKRPVLVAQNDRFNSIER